MSLLEPLTERQSEILKLIRDLTESSGFPPTRAEIAEQLQDLALALGQRFEQGHAQAPYCRSLQCWDYIQYREGRK